MQPVEGYVDVVQLFGTYVDLKSRKIESWDFDVGPAEQVEYPGGVALVVRPGIHTYLETRDDVSLVDIAEEASKRAQKTGETYPLANMLALLRKS